MPFGKLPPARIMQRIQSVNYQGSLTFTLRVAPKTYAADAGELGSKLDQAASLFS